MTAYIVATAIVASSGLVMPLMLLGTKPARIFETLKEGGGSMWLLLLLMISMPAVVTVLAGLGIRGRKIPIAAIVGVALVPALVAFAGTTLSQRSMASAIEGAGIDPSQKMRIAFEGTQEALASLQFGAAICAFALGAAAVGCAGIAASVDRARMNVSGGVGWIAALVLPLLGLVASLAVVVVTHSLGAAPIPFFFSLVSLLVVAPMAALSARSAGAFRDFHDTAESKRMLGAVLAAAVMSALALWLLDRVAILAIQRVVFSACSAESVDGSQKARILMGGNLESRAFVLLSGTHVVCALGAFVPALVAGSGKGKHPFGADGTSALALVALGTLGFFGVEARAKGYISSVAAAMHEPSYPVTLPTVKNGDAVGPARGDAIVVDKYGKRSGGRLALDDEYIYTHTFAADKDALAANVFDFAASSGKTTYEGTGTGEARVDLLVVPESHTELPHDLDPEIRAMIAPESAAVSMHVDIAKTGRRIGYADPQGRQEIVFLDEQTVSVQNRSGQDTRVRFGPRFGPELRSALGRPDGVDIAYVTLQPTTKVGPLVTLVSSLGVHRAAEVHVRVAKTTGPAEGNSLEPTPAIKPSPGLPRGPKRPVDAD
jgi:hypothetical protein